MTSIGISHFPAHPLLFDYSDTHQNTHPVRSARKLEKPRSTLHRRRSSARYSSTYSPSDLTTTNAHRREVRIVGDSSFRPHLHPRPRPLSFASCSFFGVPFKNMRRSSVLTAHLSPLSSNRPGQNGHTSKRNARVEATRGMGSPRPTSAQFRVGAGSNARKRTSYNIRPHSVVHNLRSVPLSDANARLAYRHSKLFASSPLSIITSQSIQWDFESEREREMARDYERIRRRKKIAILSRRFGENVPPDLVFPVSALSSVDLDMMVHPNNPLNPFLFESPSTPNTTTNTDVLSTPRSESISALPSSPVSTVPSPAPDLIGTPPLGACECTICKPSPEFPSSLPSLETSCTGTVVDASESVDIITPPLPSSAALLEQYFQQQQQQVLSPTLKEKEQKDRRRKTSLCIRSQDVELSRYFREAEIQKERENETEAVAGSLEVEGLDEIEETRRSIELQPQAEAEKPYPSSLESTSLPCYETNVGARPTSQIPSPHWQEYKRNRPLTPTFVIGDTGEVNVRFDYSTTPPPAPMSIASNIKSEYGPDNSPPSLPEIEEEEVKPLNMSHGVSKSLGEIGMRREVLKTEVVAVVGGGIRHSFPARGVLAPLRSGHRKEREWSGEWNLGDIEEVMSALRGLKA